MKTFIHYVRSRHFCKAQGWGTTCVRWLWLDAILFAVARWTTLHSPWFRKWCRGVDAVFIKEFDWPRNYTEDTGLDCWIDSYWDGATPHDAAYSEAEHWD